MLNTNYNVSYRTIKMPDRQTVKVINQPINYNQTTNSNVSFEGKGKFAAMICLLASLVAGCTTVIVHNNAPINIKLDVSGLRTGDIEHFGEIAGVLKDTIKEIIPKLLKQNSLLPIIGHEYTAIINKVPDMNSFRLEIKDFNNNLFASVQLNEDGSYKILNNASNASENKIASTTLDALNRSANINK